MAGMVVKNNMSALNTLNMLNTNHSQLSKSLAKVSSGMRINGAADDASGYAISERMRAQIRGLEQDNRNTQNGNSLLKVAEGAVSSTVDILKTLKEKVINAANDTNTDEDRATIQKELDQSIDQINDNANVTYNGKYLVDGTKNSQGSATYTALTNQSLSTATTGASRLVALQNRQDENLNIQAGDKVTVSYVQQGKTYSTTFEVTNTSSLATILAKAESVDTPYQTFATNSNTTVAKINGITDPAQIAALESAARTRVSNAQADVGTKSATVTSAQSSYDTFMSAKNAMASALPTLQSAFASEWSQVSSTVSGFVSNTSAQFNTWAGSTSASFPTSYPNPDTSASGFSTSYGDLHSVLTSSATGFLGDTHVMNIRSAWAAYKNVYDTYAAYGSDQETTLYQALQNAKSDLQNAQNELDNAKAALEALTAPSIIADSKVGFDASGNTVMTASREKALTITAYNDGVNGQIAGFTISVSDNQGNVKKDVNAVLDAWSETVRAQNESKNDNSIVLQTGTKANQSIKVALTDMRSEALGLKGSDGQTLNIGTQKKANAAISVLDNAIQKALDEQTKIGSIQSRLEYTAANLTTATENVQASESAIRDADMAKEMTEYTKNNVLLQTSQSMLAQANQSSSNVLGLLA